MAQNLTSFLLPLPLPIEYDTSEAIMSEDEHDEELEDIPLHRKKPFGSGLRRNEIRFVPAATDDSTVTLSTGAKSQQGQSVSDFYLNMVLKRPQEGEPNRQPTKGMSKAVELCEVCRLPIDCVPEDETMTQDAAASVTMRKAGGHHEASIAHQVCLAHSHPPSALDRSRMGLSVLEAQGWNPDARTGLGAAGQGVHYPLKVKPKDDHLGIGTVVPKNEGRGTRRTKATEKPQLLDAKKVRKMAAEDRKRTDRLQRQIFGKVDLEKYLGSGG